ncbi:MAG TPA: hypothetical protein VN607_05960, partial [Gemmatimonadaceae bacterium]|nr:hypothetical protein [Gemmatimonadaceae bacterium]
MRAFAAACLAGLLLLPNGRSSSAEAQTPVARDSQAAPAAQSNQTRPVVVASKPFGESYLLAEMFAQVLESRGIPVDR